MNDYERRDIDIPLVLASLALTLAMMIVSNLFLWRMHAFFLGDTPSLRAPRLAPASPTPSPTPPEPVDDAIERYLRG